MKDIIKKKTPIVKRFFFRFSVAVMMIMGRMAPFAAYADEAEDHMLNKNCARILSMFCPQDGDNGEAIINLVKFIINLLASGVVIAGAIGIVVCAIMWLTARDNEGQVARAKTRIVEIVVGMVIFILIDAILNLLLGADTQWRWTE